MTTTHRPVAAKEEQPAAEVEEVAIAFVRRWLQTANVARQVSAAVMLVSETLELLVTLLA
jgi:hypothetical protein